MLEDLVEQAVKRQQQSPGSTYVGAILQHIVGAKLELALPDTKIEHHGYSVADKATRSGDFDLGRRCDPLHNGAPGIAAAKVSSKYTVWKTPDHPYKRQNDRLSGRTRAINRDRRTRRDLRHPTVCDHELVRVELIQVSPTAGHDRKPS